MRFWDASAIVPLCILEKHTGVVKGLLREEPGMVVWWATPIECRSALARLQREGGLREEDAGEARAPLERMEAHWMEIRPGDPLCRQAIRCISVHGLKAADALQLAAALVWAGSDPAGQSFVCLDAKLREAARREGFTVLPEGM